MEHLVKVTSRGELEKRLRGSEVVVVAFTGITCPACQLYRPVLEEFARLAHPEVMTIEYIVDYDPEPALELGVFGTPATLVYIRGEPIEGFVGAVDLPDLVEFVENIARRHGAEAAASKLAASRGRVKPVLGAW